MKVRLDLTMPNGFIHSVDWPEGTPYPAVGDHVIWLRGEITWSFNTVERIMDIGTDPRGGGPMTHLSLTVDSDAPPNFEAHLKQTQADN